MIGFVSPSLSNHISPFLLTCSSLTLLAQILANLLHFLDEVFRTFSSFLLAFFLLWLCFDLICALLLSLSFRFVPSLSVFPAMLAICELCSIGFSGVLPMSKFCVLAMSCHSCVSGICRVSDFKSPEVSLLGKLLKLRYPFGTGANLTAT